jgi:hypothetical protein
MSRNAVEPCSERDEGVLGERDAVVERAVMSESGTTERSDPS